MDFGEFEVIIAGGGPAGSSAAIILAKAGLRVALVDDADKEQWKIGESLPGAAIRLLRRLGISDLATLLGAQNYKNCVANASAWGTEHWEYKDALKNPEGGGWHLMRHVFDEALRNKAVETGAQLIAARIHGITQFPSNSFNVELKPHLEGGPRNLQTKWLVDATGRNAAIARRLGAEKVRIARQLAAYTWLKPLPNDADNTSRVKSAPNGWWYTARLPNTCRVLAFHGSAKTVGQMAKSPGLFLNACNQTDLLPYPVTLTEHHLLNPIKTQDAGVSRLRQPFGANWLAVGDAALSFDPLSSQGMFFALYSGVRGAETLLKFLEKTELNAASLGEYAGLVDSVLAANMSSRAYYYNDRYLP